MNLKFSFTVIVILLISIVKVSFGLLVRSLTKNSSNIGGDVLPSYSNRTFREARKSVVSGGLFTLISFENVPCNGNSGEIGICYSKRECTKLGGTATGNCAGGYGTCCVVTASCGSIVKLNNTYFVNPAYPALNGGPLLCKITVPKLTGSSQLYLEFLKFNLLGPTSGACSNDSFSISIEGSTVTYPVLCGVIDAETMEYIDLSSVSGPVTITVTLSATTNLRSWKIRLVQFKPGGYCTAPAGCNQYYRSISGTLTSYNFNNGQGQLLNNYCTRICFQSIEGYCSILLTENTFMIPGISPNDCTNDYFLINGIQFCGDTLNNGMVQANQTSIGAPISMLFCSGTTHPDLDAGYNLTYNYLPCNSVAG